MRRKACLYKFRQPILAWGSFVFQRSLKRGPFPWPTLDSLRADDEARRTWPILSVPQIEVLVVEVRSRMRARARAQDGVLTDERLTKW